MLDNGLRYVKTNLPNIYINAPTWQFNRYTFMLYVLARGDQLQAGATNVVYNQRSSLSLYGKAYLAQALFMLDKEDARIQSLLSDLAGTTIMSSSGAHWEEKGDADYWNWNSDTRTTAIVLNAFIQIDPQNLVTANAVRWLMAHRESGRWHSTQETAWSLMALTNWLTATKEFELELCLRRRAERRDAEARAGYEGQPHRHGQAAGGEQGPAERCGQHTGADTRGGQREPLL